MKIVNVTLAAAVLASAVTASATEVSAQNYFFAILNGASVCNLPIGASPPLCRLGDVDGYGIATVMIRGPNSLCATIMVDKLSPAALATSFGAAHLHIGEASYSGPVILRLARPTANGGGDPGTSMMCDHAVPAATIAAIQANPQFYYIDIHAQGFTYGALRGQLF